MAWVQKSIKLDYDDDSNMVGITVGAETRYIHLDELRRKANSRRNSWDALINNMGIFISLANKQGATPLEIKQAIEATTFRFNG